MCVLNFLFRSLKISLLHIRPITAFLMMGHLALLQMSKKAVLGLQKSLRREKPLNPVTPKRGEKRERPNQASGFSLQNMNVKIVNVTMCIHGYCLENYCSFEGIL